MSRSDQRRRRVLRAVAPVAGLLAAGLLVWQGSYAAFSATTDNTKDAWTTGNLTLTNNGGVNNGFGGTTPALFGETGIKPGSTGAKCITVDSAGSLPGALRLYRGAITGTNGANLAAALTLTVDAMPVSAGSTLDVASNCSGYAGGTGGALYAGALGSLGTSYGAVSGTNVTLTGGGERVAYRIGWSLPSTVTDNTLQSSSAVATLNWEVQ